jgi:hypothetical protein
MLKEQQFRNDLPLMTACDRCGAVLTGISWNVGRFAPHEWFGIGIVKCEPCDWVKVAAAGSSEVAHQYARSVRLKFIRSLNT